MDIAPVFISVSCSAIIALVGWQVLFRNAKKLASRSESYSFISSISGILVDIKNASDEYWMKGENNDSPIIYDTFIGLKLRDIQVLLDVLDKRHIQVRVGAEAVYKVRRACTIDSTKASHDICKKERAEILGRIYGVIATCETSIYSAFSDKYPPIK